MSTKAPVPFGHNPATYKKARAAIAEGQKALEEAHMSVGFHVVTVALERQRRKVDEDRAFVHGYAQALLRMRWKP